MMQGKIIGVLAAAGATVGLAACGTATHETSSSVPRAIPSSSSSQQPADPRPTLTKTGASNYLDGTTVQRDFYGDKWISAAYDVDGQQEIVTVDTFASQTAQQSDLSRNAAPTDGSKVITLHLE